MANKSINIKLGNKDVLQKFVNDSFDNKTANNLTTTVEGFSLDARQGKVLDQKIKTVSNKVDIINGTGEGSIQDYVNDAVTKLIAGAPEKFDTLKEISDWISSHETSAASMNSSIKTNATNIATLQSNLASHTHNYAGSSSAGGAATTALACTGNSATATKLANSRTIALTGSVTGSGSFDGSGNLSIATTTNHTHNYAGSSSAGGAATSANKINTNAGSTTNPVYFADGIPKACTYTLGKSVPADAVFTDTTYTVRTSMVGLGFTKNSTYTVAEFLEKLIEKKCGSQIRVDFAYANASTAKVSDGTTTIDMNGVSCFVSLYSGVYRRIYASVLANKKQYLMYAQYDSNASTPSNQGIIDVSSTVATSCTGNSATATKLANSRTIALTGSVTGSGSFDGSGNLSIATTTNHTHSYAGSSSAGGAATSANKINTNAGSTTQPVYFADGIPKACTYSLNKTVPSNAVFTDTTALGSMTGTLSVAHGGTGATTLTSGAALIGNGTGAIGTRSITNMTTKKYITYNTNLMTTNTLAYWNGAYDADCNSNLTYCNLGAFGEAVTKGCCDSTTASAIGTGINLVTERDVYYGLPKINNAHNYTSSTNIYAPTSVGTSGYVLKSNGSGAPSWIDPSSLSVGSASSATSATKATKDGSGNTITSTYALKSIYADTYISLGRVSNTTVGTKSVAYGYNITASGDYSAAFGYDNEVSKLASFVAGHTNVVTGICSAAFGWKNAVYSDYSFNTGYYNYIYSDATHSAAFGYDNEIDSPYSFLAGKDNNVRSDATYSAGFGCSNIAAGIASFVTGYDNNVYGDYSAAFGNLNNVTTGSVRGFAMGCNLNALTGQLVTGYNNNTATAPAAPESGGAGSGYSFVIGNGSPGNGYEDNAFKVGANGSVSSEGTTMSTGADYAEYFEWADGNKKNEDRVGYFVTYDDKDPEKIRIANEGDCVLGIISGAPSVVGNGDMAWTKRYEKDNFGRKIDIEEECEIKKPKKNKNENKIKDKSSSNKNIETINEEKQSTEKIEYEIEKVKVKTWKRNPDYDSSLEYTPRQERQEWDAVGMVGVLAVYDDGTCKVNGWCKCSDKGIATSVKVDKNTIVNPYNRVFKVISRVDKNVIKVVVL